MSEEENNILTFSELRKIQKEEDREEELTEIGDKFLLRVSNYFDKKKQAEGESREYKNSRRVLDKIISLREEKIVKEARLSVRTSQDTSNLSLLPEEQEIFREIKSEFQSHRNKVEEMVESQTVPGTGNEPSQEVKETTETGSTSGKQVEAEETNTEEDSGKTEEPESSNSQGKDAQSEEDDEEENGAEEAKDGYKIVKTTSDVPEFMGTDLEAYGPFDEGEEVEIPDDNAEILVNRGNAELVEE